MLCEYGLNTFLVKPHGWQGRRANTLKRKRRVYWFGLRVLGEEIREFLCEIHSCLHLRSAMTALAYRAVLGK